MYYKAFHNVIIVLSEEKILHEFNLNILEILLEQIIEYSENEEDTLLIIDDFTSELKNGEVLKLLNSLVNNRRHLRLSIWMSVQTYKSIPLSNRKTINYLVLFKCMNKAEIRAIWEEMTFLQKDDFFNLLMYVFQKPYEYLVLDRGNNEYYRKFNNFFFVNNKETDNAVKT